MQVLNQAPAKSQPHPRRFRFGIINEIPDPAGGWIAHARRVEALGFSTLLLRDHLLPDYFGPQLGPLSAVATAAAVTTRLRVGTLVLDNDYRHPVVLAKEAATIDLLSGGRLELGLGAGWLRAEYDAAGITYDPPGDRIARLEESIGVLKGLFGTGPVNFEGKHYAVRGIDGFPPPAGRVGPTLLLGGGRPRMLRLAGREADVVSLLTSSVARGILDDDPAERSPEAVAEKIEWVREGAGARFPELELSLIPALALGARRARARELIERRSWNGVTEEDVWRMPSVLAGAVEQVEEDMRARREALGISYYVFSDRSMEAVMPIVERLSGT